MRRDGETDDFVSNIHVTRFDVAEQQPLADDFSSSTTPGADAFILYTSGSTGEPKGAVHSQSDIFYTNETFCREVLRLREGDRLFSSSRLPFAYGLGNAFTFPLLNGFTTILCREKPTRKSSRVSSAITGRQSSLVCRSCIACCSNITGRRIPT